MTDPHHTPTSMLAAPAGGGAGAMAPVALEGGNSRSQSRVRTPEIKRLPAQMPPSSPKLIMNSAPKSPHAARFRALRHRLVERGDPRVILVTSPSGREGRVFCAANLALALTELRCHDVLLIEADATAPRLASYFGLERAVCFLEQLDARRRTESAGWVTASLGESRLDLLPTAPADQRPEIDPPTFAAAMDELRRAFDYIVIAGPPVLGGPEVNRIEAGVEGTLISAVAGVTRASEVRAALDQLMAENVLGMVLLEAGK